MFSSDSCIHVHKFGGSSLQRPSSFLRVSNLVIKERDEFNPDISVVVLSARGGLTDTLHDLVREARTGQTFNAGLHKLEIQQQDFIQKLFGLDELCVKDQSWSFFRAEIHALDGDLAWLQKSLLEIQEGSPKQESITSAIAGLGEIWSARLFNAMLTLRGLHSDWLNARNFIYTHKNGGLKDIDLDRSRDALLQGTHSFFRPFWVVTGYISSTWDGLPSTLGRNGSDYSASLFASLVNAEKLTIWSDVDGILSIDPDLKEPAVSLAQVSYDEADELARLGAGVLHSHTIQPLKGSPTRLVLKNSLQPTIPGTEVLKEGRACLGVTTGLSSVQVLVFNVPENQEEQLTIDIPGSKCLAKVHEGQKLFLAIEKDDVQEVLKGMGESVLEENHPDKACLRLHGIYTTSMVAWVSHDIGTSETNRRLWSQLLKKGRRQLAFCCTNQHSLMAFFKTERHEIPTRILHRGVYGTKINSNSGGPLLAHVS